MINRPSDGYRTVYTCEHDPPMSMISQWGESISMWSTSMRAASRSRDAVYLRESQIRRLARTYPTVSPWDLTTADLEAWLAHPGWSTETRRSHRGALRAFWRWALANGLTLVDPTAPLPQIRARRGVPRPAPEPVIVEALASADERVRMAILLGATCGLRRAEAAAVRGEDRFRLDGAWWLRVVGKGEHVRPVPLSPALLPLWPAETTSGWLFPSPSRPSHLTPAHLGRLVSRAMPAGWTMHTLRHRYATNAYAAERDLLAVAELLGHARIETTRVYTLAPRDSVVRAASATWQVA